MASSDESNLGTIGSTSSSLLQRVLAQDPDAWNRLSELYGPVVLQWARQMKLREHDAADVVQDVFQAVAIHVHQFRRERPSDSFRGWLWTITRNKVRDHFRRLATRQEAVGGSEAFARLQQIPESPPDGVSTSAMEPAAAGVVRRAMDLIRDEFEPHTWQAFWRLAVDGHSADEIARDLGLSKPAVRQAKYRVLRRLRQELDGLV